VLKDLARWVRRSTKERASSKQSSPAEKIILLGGETVCTGLRKFEPLRFLKEMNILSAHQSSNSICPATESVSAVEFPGVRAAADDAPHFGASLGLPDAAMGRRRRPMGLRPT
jgi:hypothetical protein